MTLPYHPQGVHSLVMKTHTKMSESVTAMSATVRNMEGQLRKQSDKFPSGLFY